MKILLSIGFLLTLTIFILLSLKVERDQINRVLANRANRFKAHFFTFLINLLVILSYCILTLHFPIKMILASATIMFLMLFLWDVFSDSILGTNVPTIRKRIFFLVCFEGFKDGMQHPKKIDTTNMVTGTIIIASWLAALIIFWLNPVATESIRIVISILTIVNLIIAGNIVQILRTLPLVSAPYINDDVRNFNLIVGAFPNVVSSTVWLLFPIWVIYSSNGMFYNLPMWIIILIPLGTLSIINVVPYFFGLQRHQFISKAYIDIRIDLIARIRGVIALPESDIKNDLISNEIESLNEQLVSELEDNQTVKAIQLLEANSQITTPSNELGERGKWLRILTGCKYRLVN